MRNQTARDLVATRNTYQKESNFFFWLQHRGEKNWCALKEHPSLKPFAWAYQIFRVIKKLLQPEINKNNLSDAEKLEELRDTVIHACGISGKI